MGKEWIVPDDVPYVGRHQDTHSLIADTITRLPEDVAQFVLRECCFLSSSWGGVLQRRERLGRMSPAIQLILTKPGIEEMCGRTLVSFPMLT